MNEFFKTGMESLLLFYFFFTHSRLFFSFFVGVAIIHDDHVEYDG